ncbi:MAG TPA: hypothetical protein VGM89_09235 [Puia sp.]
MKIPKLTNRSWRIFVQIMLALTLGVLFYCYWNSENAQTRIESARDGILGQLSQAEKTKYSQANLTAVNAAADAVSKNEYTKPDFAKQRDLPDFEDQGECATRG